MSTETERTTSTTNSTDPFPIIWDDPADAARRWTSFRSHWPDPVTPFDFDVSGQRVISEIEHARVHYGQGATNARARRINTYFYTSQAPPPQTDEQKAEQAKIGDERIEAAIAQLHNLWENEWLPELQAHHQWWESFDLKGSSTGALIDHARESLVRMGRLWQLHHLMTSPSYAAVALFDELFHDLFGYAGKFDGHLLLDGGDNKTIETGRAFARLARLAQESPEVARVLESAAPAEVSALLAASTDGRAFLDELNATLEIYGQRFEKWSPSTLPWIEDPTPVIKNIQDYMANPALDPEARVAAQRQDRERLLTRVREQIASYPRPIVEQFEHLLRAARLGLKISEDHAYWIDGRGQYKCRRVFLEVGRRLAERGALEKASEVVYLWPEEALAALAAEPSPDQRALVDERRREMAHFATIEPPAVVGATTGVAAAGRVGAVGRAMARWQAAATGKDETGAIRGTGGSPGKVRGRARVVRSLDEARALQSGEVLVSIMTGPAWTPLFATAAAVVTDTGGMLGHCAVIAREYRIPAVVGTGVATASIQTGQVIEVDGEAGVVRVIE